jgi:uncharacterized SAM-binding protein YcdF (DUF218 family)
VNAPRRKQPVIRENARNGGRKPPMGVGGALVRLLALMLLLWLGGFLWFSLTLPEPALKTVETDAVVVLTGGKGRLKRGLAVLEAGSARRMLVSGVDRGTTRKQLAAAAGISKQRLARTDLGYEAIDTRSNAEETARWVTANDIKSIRLVTSAGHMRRARLELAQALPAGVSVLPDAVPVEPKAPSIAAEYSKYLLRRIALASDAVLGAV